MRRVHDRKRRATQQHTCLPCLYAITFSRGPLFFFVSSLCTGKERKEKGRKRCSDQPTNQPTTYPVFQKCFLSVLMSVPSAFSVTMAVCSPHPSPFPLLFSSVVSSVVVTPLCVCWCLFCLVPDTLVLLWPTLLPSVPPSLSSVSLFNSCPSIPFSDRFRCMPQKRQKHRKHRENGYEDVRAQGEGMEGYSVLHSHQQSAQVCSLLLCCSEGPTTHMASLALPLLTRCAFLFHRCWTFCSCFFLFLRFLSSRILLLLPVGHPLSFFLAWCDVLSPFFLSSQLCVGSG